MRGRIFLILITLFALKSFAIDPAITDVEKLFRGGRADEAKRAVAQYLTNHETATAYVQVGALFARLNKWPDAVHYLEIATNREEKNALAWYELGLAYHQNFQIEEAIAAMRKTLTLNAKSPKANFALGEMLELSQDRYDARNVYMAAIKTLGDQGPLRAKLCWLYFRDNYFREAVNQCARAVKFNPEDSVSWTLYARSLYDNQQRTEAFKVFQQVVAKFPKSSLTYRARGLIYFQEKTYEQAVIDLGKAFGIDPKDDEAAIHLARSLFELGHHDQALNMFVEACMLDKTYRFEFLSKQRELSRLGKEEMANQYQEALDRI